MLERRASALGFDSVQDLRVFEAKVAKLARMASIGLTHEARPELDE